MKKTTLITIAGICILGIAVVVYFASQNIQTKKPEAVVQLDTVLQTEDPLANQQVIVEKLERYQPFSENIFTLTANNTRVLFFYANWCPTCQPSDKSFRENSAQIPENVSVIRVNYNDNETDEAEKELAKKYGVTYQHTYVQIDTAGTEVTRWNGGGLAELLKKIK